MDSGTCTEPDSGFAGMTLNLQDVTSEQKLLKKSDTFKYASARDVV